MKSLIRAAVLCCVLLTPGSAQWLERQVILGDTLGGIYAPRGVVANPVSGKEYIAAMPVRVFDPATPEKVRDLAVSGGVVFCPASGKGYVVFRETLFIVDAMTDTVVGTSALTFAPDFHTYSPTSNRLYLGVSGGDTLLSFDPDGDTVLHRIGIGAAARALSWDSLRDRVYIGVVSDSGALKVLDCKADTLLPDIQVGLTTVRALALSTASRKLYCAGFVSGSWSGVVAVSTDSLVLIDTVTQSGDPDIMVYSPLTDRLYLPIEDVESLFIVDCRTDSIRSQLEAPYVTAMAVNTLDGRVYVNLEDSTHIMVLDTLDSVSDRIPTPDVPSQYTAALSFRPDRNELYGVTTSSRAFVVDAAADTVVGVLSYATYLPRQMIHNPAGNKLYLLCPAQDDLMVMDSTFGTPKHILGGSAGTYAQPVLNPALNRLYVADNAAFRVIDCSADSLLRVHGMYGINRAVPVMVPYLNRLYVFSSSTGTGGDSVYAYDCLRDTVSSVMLVSDDVPSAVYDPRSNRVFFCCADAPTLRALDPVTNTVEKTFDLVGGSHHGKLALNLDLARLYYVDQSPAMIFTIDLLTDSVIASESLPFRVDSVFLNRRLQKLYLCGDRTLVFDCARGTATDTITAGYSYAGLMDERNDKLYLRYGAVVDCRYDSVVAMLPPDSVNSRCMAWDAIDNRVFQATTSRLYVYRDDPYGVEEEPTVPLKRRHATIVRGVLFLPGAENGDSPSERLRPTQRGTVPIFRAALLDISGRKVMDLRPGANDVRALAPGVYFVRDDGQGTRDVGRTRKVVVTR